jgi:hypothetical protein
MKKKIGPGEKIVPGRFLLEKSILFYVFFSQKACKDLLLLLSLKHKSQILSPGDWKELKKKCARIIPGTPHMTALEALADLYKTLPDEAGKSWSSDSKTPGTLDKMRDPWE